MNIADNSPKICEGHNEPCNASTGICESITFGSGHLDDNGYWEKPCAKCAARFLEKHPLFWVWPRQD